MKKTHHFKQKLLFSLITASMGAVALAPSAGWAQSSNANLRGSAPPNATVTAKNLATGTQRTTTSNAQGSYSLIGLQPGTYKIDAGPGTEQVVTLTVASTATLNITAGATTAAPVSAAAPSAANAQNLSSVSVTASSLPEVKTPEVGGTISQHQIETIPQISRNFLEFADTVPGMVFSVNSQGNTSLRGGAQNNASTNVYIDGVGQKSYLFGGPSGQNASQGNPFPQLAIGEYKVITSNYKAEYGQISSAAVTAQTKSGTNEFHGEVFDRYTSDKYRARTPAENDAGFKTPSKEKEFGVAIGGPIVKDKAHFFFTYEGKRFNTPLTVSPTSDGAAGVPFLPPDIASQLGPAQRSFSENLYFGKVDWEPTDRDRFEFSAQVRKENQVGGTGGVIAASAGFTTINEDKRYQVRWQHSGEATFNELLLTYETATYSPTANNFGNGLAYTYTLPNSDPDIIKTGAADPRATQSKGQQGPAIQDDLTFNDLVWHGDHVIKTGFKRKFIKLNAADAADVNPQFTYAVLPAGTAATPYSVFFTKPVTGIGGISPNVNTKSKQFGAYVQDDWAINDKLILNLGVRWDYENTNAYTTFVTPPDVVAAFGMQDPNAPAGQTYAQSLARGGVNINDYISNGSNRSPYKGEWAPRLGFSYDLNADEAHVIHGGAGRSYDRDLYDYLQLEITKSALPQYTYYLQDPATGACSRGRTPCVPFDPALLNGLPNVQALQAAGLKAGTEVDLLNNHLKAPYSDQFSIGMANTVGEWQTDATVARVLSYDGFAFTLGNRYPDGSFYNDPRVCNANADPGVSQAFGCQIPGFGSLIIGNNGIRTRTTQVLLSANKPYNEQAGWGVTMAYTYTHAKQNRDINEHYSLDEATIGNYPFITSNAAAKHRFVATGVIDAPWGITASVKLTLATPIPYNGSLCYQYASGNTFDTGGLCTPYASNVQGNGKFLVGGKVFGFRDVDFQATKNFTFNGFDFYGRFDLLNVFNFRNTVDLRSDFNGGPASANNPVTYNRNGQITFVPRTVKFEVGMKF